MNNLNKILLCIAIGLIIFTIGYYKGSHNQRIIDNVAALEVENTRLSEENKQNLAIIDDLRYDIVASESTNQSVMDQLIVLNEEYSHANIIIKKYQDKLDSLTHIDSSFVRYIKLTQRADELSSPAAITSLFSPTTESPTASGILHYITALEQWGNDCLVINNAKDKWYNDVREKYNGYIGE